MSAPSAGDAPLLRVAVVGATGNVGRELLALLEARRFPMQALTPIATDASPRASVHRPTAQSCTEVTPSPPSASGTSAPSSPASRSASTFSIAKRLSRSAASALVAHRSRRRSRLA